MQQCPAFIEWPDYQHPYGFVRLHGALMGVSCMVCSDRTSNCLRAYGALSVPEGRVSIAWRLLPETDGNGVEFDWVESCGPPW